jgi:hypothetical protein
MVMFLLSITAFAQPPILWTQTFGGYGSYGESVQQTTDGGYIIGGSDNASYSELHLIKTDASGNEQWSQSYGEMGWDEGHSVQQTSDGGYIIGGYTQDLGANLYDAYLVKTDGSGTEQWSQAYGGSGYDYGHSVQQTSDGGYFIAGSTTSYGAGMSDVYFVKTDASGNQQWSQTYGGTGTDIGLSAQQTSDGGYIITGHSKGYSEMYSDVYLVKTDASGNQQWSQTFGGDYVDLGNSVQQTSDGGYIITGYTYYSYETGSQNVYLIKTDSAGNEQWSQTFGETGWDEGFSVQQTSDGGYIIAGFKTITSYDTDVWLIKTDASGNEEWSQTIDERNEDEARSVQQTSDGGYIIAGHTTYSGASGSSIYLIRVATETPPEIIVDLTYLSGSPVPAGGGNLDFDLYLENASGEAQDFDAWLEIAYEGGTPNTVVLRSFTNYLAGWTINRPGMYYPIASTYVAGNYTFTGKAGINPIFAWDESGFPFVKEGTDHIAGFVPFPVDGAQDPFDEIIKGDSHNAPAEFGMINAYPNPFNPTTVLSYQLSVISHVSLRIYDVSGRLVESPLNNVWRDAGVHEITFDASNLTSGLYIYRLTAGDLNATGKMVLLK